MHIKIWPLPLTGVRSCNLGCADERLRYGGKNQHHSPWSCWRSDYLHALRRAFEFRLAAFCPIHSPRVQSFSSLSNHCLIMTSSTLAKRSIYSISASTSHMPLKYWRTLKNIEEHWRTLKNIEEHWRTLKNLACQPCQPCQASTPRSSWRIACVWH